MEYLIVIALLAIIFLCIGFSLGDVIFMLVALLCVGILLVGLFFLFSLVVLLTSRPIKATFVRMNEDGRYPCAVYKTDNAEIKNIFPCEMVLKDKLYVPEKEIKIRRCAFIKAALDKNAVMTIIFGSIVFIPLSAAVIFAVKYFFGI